MTEKLKRRYITDRALDFPTPSDALAGNLTFSLAELPVKAFSQMKYHYDFGYCQNRFAGKTGGIIVMGRRYGPVETKASVYSWHESIAVEQLETVRWLALGEEI